VGRLLQRAGNDVQPGDSDIKRCVGDPSIVTPKPQLTCVFCTSTFAKVTWIVDCKRLQSKDRILVSPPFDLPLGKLVPFRLMVQPKEKFKGGDNFAKARGLGSIQLKCEDTLMEEALQRTALTFRLAVGQMPWRAHVRHDFAGASAAGLPAGQQEWNFRKAADPSSQTITISLEAECA